MTTETRDLPTVMRMLLDHRVRLVVRMREIETDNDAYHFDGQYYPNAYDCSTARARALDSLFRDFERCEDDIMMVDDEMAVMGMPFGGWKGAA